MAKMRYDEALLLRIRTLESKRRYKSAEFWKHADGLPYKVSKIIFYITLLPFFFWQFIYVFANPYSALTKNKDFGDWRRNMTVVALTTAFMLAAFVLSLLKKYLLPLIFSVITAVVSCVFFNQALQIGAANSTEVSEVNAHVSKLIIRHVVPLTVMCFAILIPFLIETVDKRAERAAYDHAAAQLYEKFRRRQDEAGITGEMMTPEQWNALVREYDGETHYGRLKRSLKSAKRKAVQETPPPPEDQAD